MAAAKKEKYRANWRLSGVGKADIEAGETVDLTAEDAAPLVAAGVLSKIGDAKQDEETGEE